MGMGVQFLLDITRSSARIPAYRPSLAMNSIGGRCTLCQLVGVAVLIFLAPSIQYPKVMKHIVLQ